MMVFAIFQLVLTVAICCLVASTDLALSLHFNADVELPTKGNFWPPFLPLSALWSLPSSEKARFFYFPAMTVLTLLGMFVSRFYFSLQLLGLIRQSAILRTVTVAVTNNYKSLLLTVVLQAIVLYIFTVAGYILFPSDFVSEETGEKYAHMAL